jgi:hypothetical protein
MQPSHPFNYVHLGYLAILIHFQSLPLCQDRYRNFSISEEPAFIIQNYQKKSTINQIGLNQDILACDQGDAIGTGLVA